MLKQEQCELGGLKYECHGTRHTQEDILEGRIGQKWGPNEPSVRVEEGGKGRRGGLSWSRRGGGRALQSASRLGQGEAGAAV